MRGLIRRLAVKVLIGGAGVVDFIKVGAVVPPRLAHAGILLVDQVFHGLFAFQHALARARVTHNGQG